MNTRQNNFKLIKITWEISNLHADFLYAKTDRNAIKKKKRRGTLHAVLHMPGGAEQLQMK